MILSDGTIKELIKKEELVITPLNDAQIQPASVDCTLGTHFLRIDDSHRTHLDFENEIKYQEITADKIVIPPQSFLLATTNEYIKNYPITLLHLWKVEARLVEWGYLFRMLVGWMLVLKAESRWSYLMPIPYQLSYRQIVAFVSWFFA